MSRETKYYTPAPEDIRVGFECEKFYSQGLDLLPPGWHKTKLDRWDVASAIKFPHDYRVPYLAAEQIEAERWEKSKLVGWEKGSFEFNRFGRLNSGDISCYFRFMGKDIYQGKCRCINDFRLICKLLGI